MKWLQGACAAAAAFFCSVAHAAEPCAMVPLASLPVHVVGARVLIDVSINGKPAQAIVDTGAFSSSFFHSKADALGLKVSRAVGTYFIGIGGDAMAYTTNIGELRLGKWTEKNIGMWVLEKNMGEDAALLLGEDFLSNADIEFDLASSTLRLFKSTGDCRKTPLAYWGNDWSYTSIEPRGKRGDPIRFDVLVNGLPVHAMVDSGSPTSLITAEAAKRVGFTPADVMAVGKTGGIGKREHVTALAQFKTLQLGDETIKNPVLMVSGMSRYQLSQDDPIEMIVGLDFLRAHRTLVAYSQNKFYFTPLGGRVFQTYGPDEEPEPEPTPAAPPKP